MILRRGFTLIELLIAVTVTLFIVAALYLSLKTAFDSYQVSQDMLFLQKVSTSVMEKIIEGPPDTYGLRDALEIVSASQQHLSVVMPWTDDTHQVYTGVYTYTLNKHIKPGTPLPIAEVLLPDSREYKIAPIAFIDQGESDAYPKVQLKINVPGGSRLRFIFHPDYKKDADVLTTWRYNAAQKALFIEDRGSQDNISANIFDVKISDFLFRYFDNANALARDSSRGIETITGIEIAFKCESKNGNLREAVSFVSLRNAPMSSGNITLKEGTKISIPDSKKIKALFLTNLSGISNNDELVLEAKPQAGTSWLLAVRFSKAAGSIVPIIESYSIEYPSANKVLSEMPRVPAELGLNLLSLGANGLYDYDDDKMQDRVILEGDVTLEVKKMDIGGAAVFVKP